MRYAVTGATGLLGNNLARLLLQQGHQVIAAVRPTSDTKSLQDLDVQIATGNITEADFLDPLIDKVDGVFHVAALIWFGRSHLEESRQVNVDATVKLAEKCREKGRRFVFVSSVDTLAASTADEPANEQALDPPKTQCAYIVTKREAEKLVLRQVEQGLDGVIANPGFMIGPYDWKPSSGQMILAIADGWVPVAPGGGFSVADVRDIAQGLIGVMEKGRAGERYILSGTNITYLELWQKFAVVIGKRGPIFGMPNWLARTVGICGDVIAKITGHESHVNSLGIELSQMYNYYDSSKAERELGFSYRPAEPAIQDAWDWLRENGYSKRFKRDASETSIS